MLLPTFEFGLFFLLLFGVYWQFRERAGREILLAASYFFYGLWDIRYLLVLLLFSLGLHFIGLQLAASQQKSRKQFWLASGLAAGFLTLGFFKYFDFFLASSDWVFSALGWPDVLPALDIVLPVGLSFFTFQGLTYLWDLYRGEVEANTQIRDTLLFVAFFPSILSGPIARAKAFLPQIREVGARQPIAAEQALAFIIAGAFKKVVLSSYLASEIVDPVFAAPDLADAYSASAAMLAYSAQIYFDFSGYSDMAIGVAMLLGFQLPENFNAPYRARNIQDFWRRWHISFSSWLRDYLYIPLGGNRRGRSRRLLNLVITMLLCGLWHGAAWTYVFWGALHALAMLWLEFWRGALQAAGLEAAWRGSALARFAAWLCTFLFVTLAWVFFRAESFEAALDVLAALAVMPAYDVVVPLQVWVVIALCFVMQRYGAATLQRMSAWQAAMPAPLQALALAAIVFVIIGLGPKGLPSFIYFAY